MKEKMRVRDTMLQLEPYIWQRKGNAVDLEVIERRKILHNVDASIG